MGDPARFSDRHEAGRRLAALLERFRSGRPIVAAIPRGGVPVAAEVARALDAPLEIVVARKLGAPTNPEYGIGAVAEGGARVISERAVRQLRIDPRELAELIARAERELVALTERLRAGRPALPVAGRTVILIDDGLATGRTARAAALSLRRRGAARVVLAVPVAASGSVAELRGSVDEVVCDQMPHDLWAIGFWYEDFKPTSEQEVTTLLRASAASHPDFGLRAIEVSIDAGAGVVLPGELSIPQSAHGAVVFAQGSGSSRLSPRNRAVSAALNAAGLATLLLDLLTPAEERDRASVFDIALLAERLVAALRFLAEYPSTRDLPLGCFGASTGAAAALVAAAELDGEIGAVVSRGGRPDLAGGRLPDVTAPTLLIVGGEDTQVLELNRQAQTRLRCPSRLQVVPGAGHLFDEPGALAQVARWASDWFMAHLARQGLGEAVGGAD